MKIVKDNEYVVGDSYCVYHNYTNGIINKYYVTLSKIIHRKDDITELVFKDNMSGLSRRTLLPISSTKQYGIIKIERI